MRFTLGIFACVGLMALGAGCVTSAPRPQSPSSVSAQPAAAAAASTPADASKAKDMSEDEKYFLAAGYKPEMHNGEKVYCRRDAALGSRLVTQKTCGTLASLAAGRRQTQADVEQAQRVVPITYH